MNIELFDKAVEFIASREDKQLNLGNWQNSLNIAQCSKEVDCGTIACAGGWLALNPEFEALGLYAGSFGTPKFKGLSSYEALANLFGISEGDAHELFSFRTFIDIETFGEVEVLMTDRQLWLSRARLIRDRYFGASTKYRVRPVEVEAFTFEQMLSIGRSNATSVVNGVPWSFTVNGYPVTHESDDCYIVQLENGPYQMTKDRLLVINRHGSFVCDKGTFEATHERI